MHPETLLAITAELAGFLLKTSLAFAICWMLSKVVLSPAGRFLVWFVFLTGSGCYWLWLIEGFAPHWSALAPLSGAMSAAVPLAKWRIESSWASPLSLLLRGLGVLYLFALGYFLFTHIKKQVHLRWVLHFAYRVPDEVEAAFRPIANSLRVGNARLMMLSGIHSPGTFGWLNPTILLPPFCIQQGQNELEIVFRHELQHIRRRDFAFTSIASLCRAVLFFHPAMGYAMRRLRLESELACDLAVVGDSPERRATYAECLVRFARLNMADEPQPWNLDFAGSSSIQLKARIRSVLAETRKIPGWLIGLRAVVGLALLAGFLAVVPSFFIVLSYEQHRIVQPVKPTLLASRASIQQQNRPKRRVHALRFPLSRQVGYTTHFVAPDVPVSAPVEAAAVSVPPVRSDAILSSGPLPTLKRRSASGRVAAQKSYQTTTILLSGHSPSYSGDQGARHRTLDSIMTTMSDIGRMGHGDKDGH